jgi:hypothetical protein
MTGEALNYASSFFLTMDCTILSPINMLSKLLAANTPISELSGAEMAFLSDPACLTMALPFGMSMPKEVEPEYGPTFLTYFDLMAHEMRIQLRNKKNPKFEQYLCAMVDEVVEHTDINVSMAYEMVKMLKVNQFPIAATTLDNLLARGVNSPALSDLHDEKTDYEADLIHFISEQKIENGFEFCLFLTDELSMLPANGVKSFLAQLHTQNWAVDALLLLSLHREPAVASSAAQVLSTLADQKWKQLSRRSYLSLIQRFAIEPVKAHLPKWNKLVMKYAPQDKPCQVSDLYVSFADGNKSIIFYGLIKELGAAAEHLIGGVFRLGYGLVDGSFQSFVEPEHYASTINVLRQELSAVNCDPLLLSHLIPWALEVQKSSHEVLGVEMLELLSLLPSQWIQPQVFDLDSITKLCKLDVQDETWRSRARQISKLLQQTPLINTWMIPDVDLSLTKPNQVREHYYFQQPQRYIEALAFAAMVSFYSRIGPSLCIASAKSYLGAAYVLKEGAIGRKSFPLFDWLAEKSLAHREQEQAQALMEDPTNAKGLVIKIELLGAKPKIWRRFTVTNGIDLQSFHYLIQDIMGWSDSHLFMFQTEIGNIDGSDDSDLPAESIPLAAVLQQEGDSINYVYDFGDYWEHSITLEKINKRDCKAPLVSAGSGACPPEDCGGIGGYDNLLRLLKKKTLTADESEYLQWCGVEDEWDTSAFNKQAINAILNAHWED